VVKFLHNHSDFRNIEMHFDLYSSPLNLLGNEQELRQVVINLLINACHAVDKEGIIHLTTCRNSQGDSEIWVQDNGRGIKPENLSRIFDPFFTTKPVGQGTGLGLSVSYGIIKKHGGRIEVKSVENRGALFKVILPCTTSPLTEHHGCKEEQSCKEQHGCKEEQSCKEQHGCNLSEQEE